MVSTDVPKWCNDIVNLIKNNWKSIIFVIFLISLIFFIFSRIFPYYDPIKANSSLDIINLLVQIEATIIAIVITLSLVAVQLAAQSYSTRVIEIFKKNNSFRAILALYTFAIIFGVFTLILADNKIEILIIQKLILIDYYIGIVSVLALVLFIWEIFNLLKPSHILKELSKSIKKDNILDHISDKKKEDPIQPIIDILQASLLKYDNTTVNEGLANIDIKLKKIFRNLNILEKNNVIGFFLHHFKRISNLAIIMRDEESLIQIINIYLKNGILSSEWKYDEEIFELSSSFIIDIGKLATNQRMNIASEKTVITLGKISKIAVENNNSKVIDEIRFSLDSIISSAIDNDVELLASKGAQSLVKLQNLLIMNKIENPPSINILAILFNLINKAVEDEKDTLAFLLLGETYITMQNLIKNKLREETIISLKFMSRIREECIKNKMFTTALLVCPLLVNLLKLSIEYDNNESLRYLIIEILDIGEHIKSDENENQLTKSSMIKSLKNLSNTLESFKHIPNHQELFDLATCKINKIIEDLEPDCLYSENSDIKIIDHPALKL